MATVDERIEEIRRRLEGASPGQWRALLDEQRVSGGDIDAPEFRVEVELFGEDDRGRRNVLPCVHLPIAYQANAEFIAHAHQDIPWLLDALQRERERREELEGALREIAEAPGEPPCSCDWDCDCGNVGDTMAMGFWRGEKAQSDRARQALKGET